LFAEAASDPAPAVAKKPGFLYQKCIIGFAIRVEKGQKLKKLHQKGWQSLNIPETTYQPRSMLSTNQAGQKSRTN
jgi:hypothetical protein